MAKDTQTQSALARKLAMAQDERQGDTRSILRALRLALARAADDSFGLIMSVIGATQARRDQDDVGRAVGEDRLYLMLAGPEDVLGAACIDRACVTAILQQQTMGQVFNAPPSERAFTGTDAAMVAPLIETLLPRALDLCEQPLDRLCLAGYEYCARAETRRGLVLMLEYDRYRVFDLTIEIAGGKSQGHITLILPDLPESAAANAAEQDAADGRRLDQSFGAMRAELNAVVSRVRLPLSTFAKMGPGDVLPLIENKLDRTEVLTIDGQQIALARLGQCGGMRALRLNEKLPEPEMVSTSDDAFDEHRPALTKSAPVDEDVIDHVPFVAADDDLPDLGDLGLGQAAEMPDDVAAGLAPLSPEQAAAEISELAGLAQEDLSGNPDGKS